MASPFDRLMNTATTRLPGAIHDAIRLELFNVCLEFFRISDAWREEIEFTMPANTNEVSIAPLAGRIERLVAVTSDGYPVRGAFFNGEGVIRLPYPPTSDTLYTAHVSLTVSDPVTRDTFPIIPANIVERYHEALLDGILYRMMSQPAKPYSNTQLAAFHKRGFTGGASRARNAVNTGNTVGSQNWAFPQSFNRSR